ncbi:hypothetical protein JDV02_004597 [Purpureocillium takamizusanense]|uniref:Zn(2)-C6 fungal-type domain-containing protein n=1 Tax=Purpureocillium takamizusanense TaxID=2060973 RepID=A0A9Q8QE78_9HYPO|nr:uncharacterized protein JDV02_004597 [Purpureocillium takamizusanense]UNI18323.1 hypothetical protein JDV02_004597 [Purpureocillium takamizusanense]
MKVRQVTVCHTCRARKVGCDGKRPSCTQCAMSRRKCAGYNHDLIFVPMSKTGSRIRHGGQVSSKKPFIRDDDVHAEPRRRRAALEADALPVQRQNRRDHLAIGPALQWPLQHIILLLIQNFAPAIYPDVMGLDASCSPPRICGSWVELLPDMAGQPANEAIITAPVRTLATSILARGYHGIVSMGEALMAHGTALRSVNHALANADKTNTNVLAASVMCLMISELILPRPDAGTPQAHALGLEALLKLQDPAYYAVGPAHRLFLGLRPAVIVQAICARNPTFLAEPSWKTVPFRLIKPAPLHELMTVAADVPKLLRDFDQLMAGVSDGKSIGLGPQKLLSSHLGLLHALETWHDAFYERLEQPSHWSTHENDDRPCLWFSDITIANCLTHYWALWILCVENIRLLRAKVPALGALAMAIRGQVPENAAIKSHLRQVAVSILDSANYLMQDDMKLYGATSLILPLQIAFKHLRSHHPREWDLIEACDSTIDLIEAKGFHYIGHFLRATSNG